MTPVRMIGRLSDHSRVFILMYTFIYVLLFSSCCLWPFILICHHSSFILSDKSQVRQKGGETNLSINQSSWHSGLSKKTKSRLQVCQNKLIRTILKLPPRTHLDHSIFKLLNWLPVEKCVYQLNSVTYIKLLLNIC